MSDSKDEKKAMSPGIDDALLQVNKLSYRLPAEIGIAKSRTHQVDLFQSRAFTPGQRMILQSQTGSAYVDPRQSWLQFTIAVGAGTGSFDFGSGSSMNMINEVIIKSRSGQELSRLETANLSQKIYDQWTCPQSWFNSAGSVMGYCAIESNGYVLTNRELKVGQSGGTTRTYCIPLCKLSPFFDQKTMLPPQVMEGMQVEIVLESFASTFFSDNNPAATSTTYTVNPEIHWSVVVLADRFNRKLNEMAAKNGLYLLHKERFHQQTTVSAGNQANFDVKKAASKALMAVTVTRDISSSIDNVLVDTMGSAAGTLYETAQSHIGNDYFPQAKLTGGSTLTSAPFYMNALNAFGKDYNCWYPPATSLTAFNGNDNKDANSAVYGVKLNKSGVSDLDGYQVNNSRAFIVDIKYSTNGTYRLDTWLEHIRAVQVFTNSVVVRD